MDKESEIVITEIGGTVGDIEGLPFLEAIRQFRLENGAENCLSIHLTLVPYIPTAGEIKTKPTQHSVIKLREIGVQPDILICRSQKKLTKSTISKISLFTNVPPENVISGVDTSCIYEIPYLFHEQNLAQIICKHFNIPFSPIDLSQLKRLVYNFKHPEKEVTIALCGKYVRHQDAYKSIIESLVHGGLNLSTQVRLKYVDTDTLFLKKNITENELNQILQNVDAILVPGGFGVRGIEGKIRIIEYARKNNIPFLGICLGMQCAVIEFARNVIGWSDANSSEFDKNTQHPVIDLMPEQKKIKNMGGTMRLGAYPCRLVPNTMTYRIYNQDEILERHRHRYEFNTKYQEIFESHGMKVAGTSPDKKLVEIVEITDHRFFIGVQFHPEFKSRPLYPHPIFKEFVNSALKYKLSKN